MTNQFTSFATNAQSVFQPGFAGTNPQQVRQQIASDGGFGYGTAGVSAVNAAGLSNVGAVNAVGLGNVGTAYGIGQTQPAFGNVQAVFQPGFAGTNPQQVRQQIASDGGFGYGAVNAAGLSNVGAVNAVGLNNVSTAYGYGQTQPSFGNVQAVFQPGFAGTNPQQVRQQIARDGGFAYTGSGLTNTAGSVGLGQTQPAIGGVQSVFQPGFAGTNPQEVRQQIARDGGFGYGNVGVTNVNTTGFATNAVNYGFGQTQPAFGNVQAIFQPGFAGTNPQEVRQQIASDGGFGYGNAVVSTGVGFGGNVNYGFGQTQPAFGNVQAIFQPGFAGTNPQEVRQQIANDGGFAYTGSGLANTAGGFVQTQPTFGGVQTVFQPGFAGTNLQQVRQPIASDISYGF